MFGCVAMVIGPPSGERASESLLQDAFLGTRLCESHLVEVDYQHAAPPYGGIRSRGGPGAVAVCWIDTIFRGLWASALVCRCPEIRQSGGSSERLETRRSGFPALDPELRALLC